VAFFYAIATLLGKVGMMTLATLQQSVRIGEPLKIKVKVKVAGFRPGSRHTFGWPPKSMQKPA
jgi:hypothetical protein